MLQTLYDDLYLLPIMKKNTAIVNDKAAKGRHSGLELMKSTKGHILVKIIEYVPYTGVTKTIIKKTTNNTSVIVTICCGGRICRKNVSIRQLHPNY